MLIVFCINFNFILCNSDFDFILYYNLLLCFIPLEMRVRLICAIKFYLLTYLIKRLSILPEFDQEFKTPGNLEVEQSSD